MSDLNRYLKLTDYVKYEWKINERGAKAFALTPPSMYPQIHTPIDIYNIQHYSKTCKF